MSHYQNNEDFFKVLNTLDDLPHAIKIALFGAGETGQEFARRLKILRPDVEVLCFFDSFREGNFEGIPIFSPANIESLQHDVWLIITSVFWKEIAAVVNEKSSRNYWILSNDLINQASHLSSYGPFYFLKSDSDALERRFSKISPKFRTALDKDIYRSIFNLRVYRSEQEFFSFADKFLSNRNESFETNDKYSKFIKLDSVAYVVEGGVFDGEDTYYILKELNKYPSFKKIYAFDPFLDPLINGAYFKKINSKQCEFYQKVLWDSEESIGFRVDSANPANSTVLKKSEFAGEGYSGALHSAITIDSFLEKIGSPVDLIKLDVEGSEMSVLNGAKESILKYRPKMAISLYHRKEHLLEIPELLLSLHSDYTFSISINNPTFVDMVLYAM
jgi:FkbM family methyltransferase